MRGLREAGCDRVLGIGSVGGLRAQYGPGTFLCPDDFIALDAPVPPCRGSTRTRCTASTPMARAVVEAWR